MNPTLKYKEGFKYQVAEDYVIQTNVHPELFICDDFMRLDTDGTLYIFKGYAWDGASGPAIDTKNFIVGSLVHDALCQMLREGLLDPKWLPAVDNELTRLTANDGMSGIRCWWIDTGLSFAQGSYAVRQDDVILEAP